MEGGWDLEWWQRAVVYQIYPRSFADSDGDGVGDIPGIVDRLDYLDELGVDVVWLSPVYDSPMVDNGYDVRDYRAIDETFGTLSDVDDLVEGLHDRGMRLVMDLVVNHTSDQHEWFRASRRREEPYDDYYVWREGEDGGPPNNWEAVFGGSAWTYDEERGEYYLSVFSSSQPDLNWVNPRVREEVRDLMRWWLERDVDGFRIDVVNFISKAPGLPDGDPDAPLVGAEHFINGPNVQSYLRELDETVLAEYDAMVVGEMPGVTLPAAREYLESGLDSVFHFDHVRLGAGKADTWRLPDWDLAALKAVIERWQTGLADHWNAPYFGNHDQPRVVSHFGDEAYREASAKLLATLLLTLRGTPFVYQGDELGMTNYPFETPEEFRDVETRQYVESALRGEREFADIAPAVRFWSRDNARTPMQWSDEEHAGFTAGEPWLSVNPNYATVNARREMEDPDSVWHYYRRAIATRKAHPGLVAGDFEQVLPDHPAVFAYRRASGRYLVLLHFSASESSVAVDWSWDVAERLLGNYPAADTDGGESTSESRDVERPAETDEGATAVETVDGRTRTLTLRPYEARVYEAAGETQASSESASSMRSQTKP